MEKTDSEDCFCESMLVLILLYVCDDFLCICNIKRILNNE